MALILAQLELDIPTLAAALLHDEMCIRDRYEAYLTLVTGRDKSTLGANICIQRKEEKLSPTDYNLRRQQLEQLDRSELRETIRQAILGKYDYHEKQLEAINALEAGQSSLVILATGRGKSAIFQTVAAELARCV